MHADHHTTTAPDPGTSEPADMAVRGFAADMCRDPGRRIRQQVLYDIVDENGSQYLVAFLNADGTLGLLGLDNGKGVSDFWGEGLDDYEYTYNVATDRIPALIEQLGGEPGEDVLALLRRFHDDPSRHGLHRLLINPPVEAKFHNWIH